MRVDEGPERKVILSMWKSHLRDMSRRINKILFPIVWGDADPCAHPYPRAKLRIINKGVGDAELVVTFGSHRQLELHLYMQTVSDAAKEVDRFDAVYMKTSASRYLTAEEVSFNFREAHRIPECCSRIVEHLTPLHHLFRGDILLRMGAEQRLEELERKVKAKYPSRSWPNRPGL
jgi:hypothetical protein